MNRACHRHTAGLALPDRRMISVVPQPSSVARMISARQTCFCGALRLPTIASKPTAISQRDVDDNSCSHNESLNCFGQLGIAQMNQTSSYTIDQDGKGVARLQAQGDHRSDVTIL
jgi:hypothetical protein